MVFELFFLVTGIHDLDEYVQSQIFFSSLNIAATLLQPSGIFVSKIFRGTNIDFYYNQTSQTFQDVICVKPRSSRNSSFEAFIVGKRLKSNMKVCAPTDDVSFITSNLASSPDSDKTYLESNSSNQAISAPTMPPYREALVFKKNK